MQKQLGGLFFAEKRFYLMFLDLVIQKHCCKVKGPGSTGFDWTCIRTTVGTVFLSEKMPRPSKPSPDPAELVEPQPAGGGLGDCLRSHAHGLLGETVGP